MNVAVRKPMTLAEFLAWEARQEVKHEFDGGRAVATAGGTAAHAIIQRNLAIALQPRLRRPCDFFGSDLKFVTAEGTVRYPDGMVVCAPVDGKAKWVENPTIVFEALSPSTTRTDRIDKAREYQATPSVQHYVMLEQDGVQAVVYSRNGENWTHDILRAEATLALPAVGVAFPLAEIYEGIVFQSEDSDSEPD